FLCLDIQNFVGVMADSFDALLTQLGTGKWNIFFALASSFRFLLSPSQSLSSVYLAPSVNYTCQPHTVDHVIEVKHDSCSYVINSTSTGRLEDVACIKWTFDKSVFSSTLTSEFELVCEREYLRPTYQSVYMLGTCVGPLVCGYFADRKIVYVVSQIVVSAASLGLCLLHNFSTILFLRFIIGCSELLIHLVLALEVCEPRHRATMGILTGMPWALGTMLWGGAAYAIRDWRWLQLAASLPSVLMFPALYYLDESPRWLIVQGHASRAQKVLEKAARWNKTSLPSEYELKTIMSQIKRQANTEEEEAGTERKSQGDTGDSVSCGNLTAPRLLSTRKIITITVAVCFLFLSAALVFDGLNLGGDLYSENIFLYLIFAGLMEFPGCTLSVPIVNRYGRKRSLAVCFVCCSIMLFTLTFIPTGHWQLMMTLALLGKMFISAAFQIIYVYSNEVFPTEVRVQGVETGSAVGQVAAIIVPFISIYLGPVIPWLPSVVFGTMSILASVSLTTMKETKGANLPDTIAQLELSGKKEESPIRLQKNESTDAKNEKSDQEPCLSEGQPDSRT
ncbi:Organic cation transporter protein-like 24, partial [Homarus americanus]